LARSTQIYFETAFSFPQHRPERRSFNMASLGAVLNDTTLEPPVEALVVFNSNPAVVVPGQNEIVAGLEREDLFTVVLEQFMTDTARYADVVLPVTTQLEHLDLMIAWGHLYVALNRPAIEPRGQAKSNSEIFRRLAAAMGVDGHGLGDSDEAMVRQLLDTDHEWAEGITYERLHDEGWARLSVPAGHRPYVDTTAATPDGKLRLGGLEYRVGGETPEGNPDLADRYPLILMSRKQHTKFLNANYGGFERHLPREGEPLLEIHADDAAVRGVGNGDRVEIRNDRGSLTLAATVSADVQPGLVTIPFGWWHRSTPEGRGVNALMNPTVDADGTGSAYFHENLVEVTKID
jgi:anaerobic selenocysteine-containing dehydrogenase